MALLLLFTVATAKQSAPSFACLDLRGGARKKPVKASLHKKTATGQRKVGTTNEKSNEWVQKYKRILPLTRLYITMVAITTLAGLILGEELTQTVLALDPGRLLRGFQLWRPFTAATFLGPPSMKWLLSAYYLFQYGSSLEQSHGTPQHLVFLLSQIILLSVFSILAGQPFFADAMITSMLHVLSRANPHQNSKWIIFTVPYWTLPYGLMASDVLQAQSATAAVPHILGILSGHFYQFYKFIWPQVHHGDDWLIAPDFVQQRLDPDASISVKKKVTRNRTKGRKLGG
jgi:derlin-1